jgi:hypothetical protein
VEDKGRGWSVYSLSPLTFNTARNASCGISTRPTRFLPSFWFSAVCPAAQSLPCRVRRRNPCGQRSLTHAPDRPPRARPASLQAKTGSRTKASRVRRSRAIWNTISGGARDRGTLRSLATSASHPVVSPYSNPSLSPSQGFHQSTYSRSFLCLADSIV